jgi:predicted PurR-regulated permease PerM
MNPLFDKPFTFDRVSRIVFSVLMIGGLIYLLAVLKNALLPFLIAWLMAYMMQPFVRFFQYKLKFKSRVLSITAVLVSLAGLLILLYQLVVPSIIDEIQGTFQLLQTHQGNPENIPLIPESWRIYIVNQMGLLHLSELVSRENLLNTLKQIAPRMWTLLSSTFSLLFSITILFVVMLYFIFILLDYEKIAEGWIKLIPERYRPFAQGLAEDVEVSMNRYFRGQALIALCVGVLFAIGFKIIDFPLAVSLGLFIGFLNLIPYLQTLGLIPMLLLSLLKAAETGGSFWLIFGSALLVLCVVQGIQDLFLTPKIMGKAMGLNPAIILLSLSIWGTLLGFVGLIVALPLTTLSLSYYKRFILMEQSKIESDKTRRQLKREKISGDQ